MYKALAMHVRAHVVRWRTVTVQAAAALFGLAMATVPVHAANDAGAPAPGTNVAGAVAETPFAFDRRARADGAVQASVEDEALARWNVGGSGDAACVSNRPGFHVAPRVMVDTDVRSGRLPASQREAHGRELSRSGVLAQTRNRGYWPFRLCFEAGLRRAPKLKGKTTVRIVIGRSGSVASGRLVSTELDDREVASCLVAKARSLRFSPPPARKAEVDVSVDLSPGDAPLPGTAAAAAPDGAPCNSTFDARETAVALGAAVIPATSCYAEGISRDPKLWGRLGLRLDVAADGTLQGVREDESHFPDPRVTACVVSALANVRLPPPHGGPIRLGWGLRFGSPPVPAPAAASARPGSVSPDAKSGADR
jgi:hypothetical protein